MGWAFDAGKIALTALIIFSVAQVSERSTLMAAVLASIPIVSVLSMMMMHHEGQTAMEISGFAKDIVWLVIPSLLMFIVMPWLCLLYTSPSPRDLSTSRMPSSA